MFRPSYFVENKSALLTSVVIVIVGSLSIPIILPHVFHGFHVAHILLHVGGLTLAVFITILALMAFRRIKTKRLLYTSIAFGMFIMAETTLLIDATWPLVYKLGSVPLTEIGHILTFTTLGLLAIGVLKND